MDVNLGKIQPSRRVTGMVSSAIGVEVGVMLRRWKGSRRNWLQRRGGLTVTDESR